MLTPRKCSTDSPVISGGGPLSDCSLSHLHETPYPTMPFSLIGFGGTVDEDSGNEVVCHTDLDM